MNNLMSKTQMIPAYAPPAFGLCARLSFYVEKRDR